MSILSTSTLPERKFETPDSFGRNKKSVNLKNKRRKNLNIPLWPLHYRRWHYQTKYVKYRNKKFNEKEYWMNQNNPGGTVVAAYGF